MAKKILLADDSITIQKVVELTFSDGDYEVTAVNNGAKAIQKLSEMRPDIILSDIIMPEKNGYEVCEFVKSHPEYRNIPVILLTGTFEPFDPDRADKAGCDAVVTKPFESQSLIHKVEELVEQARANAPAAAAPAPAPAESASPWGEEEPAAAAPAAPAFAPQAPPAPASEDVFGAPPPAEAFSGETRAFPKMDFEQLAKQAAPPQPPPPPPAPATPSPWQEPAALESPETRAFPKMSFEDMQRAAEPSHAAPPMSTPEPEPEAELPFGAPPPAEQFSGETRAFPKMDLEALKAAAAQPATPATPPTPPPPAAAQENAPSPWDEQPAYSGETRAFPKLSFDEIEGRPTEAAAAQSAPASPWDQAPATPPAPAWSMPEPEPEPEPEPAPSMAAPEPPAWTPPPPPPPPAPAPVAAAQPAMGGNGVDLSEEQVDRIARRVVQLMSDQVVRSIAWEVIPDLAEMVVKERIRQLETE